MRGPADPEEIEPAALMDWLLGDAKNLPNGPAVLKELCLRLNAEGLQLARGSFHVRTLHPQLFGVGYRWYRGRDEIDVFRAEHGVRDTDLYRRSPLRLVFDEEVDELRQRLDLDTSFAFPFYSDLKAEGITEYLGLPLTFSDGKRHATTWSSDRPGGFLPWEIEQIRRLLPAFGLLIEIHLNRRIAINLLDTYVGHQAGERILRGDITRGSGESVCAAIWFSDLRDFTAMSEIKGRDELLALLNDYFDCLAGSVTNYGGEILKFIGDAMLAIFPLDDDACRHALDAAIQAQAAMAELNAGRAAKGQEPLACGIALHVGEVMYGNIGSADRLDFTVIGPAVNLASRIEGMCRALGASILLSDSFVSHGRGRDGDSVDLRSLGQRRLAGIAREVELFTPSPDADAAT